MNNLKLKYIIDKHILNQNIVQEQDLRDVTLKVVYG